ncbi:MAG TPA: hypothetical protein VD866_10220 [Urbifossiella sp.]|nr:hypothetical protein [Urbifossiella sp.]
MDGDDPELAAEVVCAIARAVLAAEGDADQLQAIPLGNTVQRLVAMRDDVPAGESDEYKLVALASAVQRAKDGDRDAREQLPGLVRGVREWFGLRN